MRRRSATTSISLFPFLAVLLCAMGALILLLVVLTRQIREAVAGSSVEIASPEIASPEIPIQPAAALPPATIEHVVVTIPAAPAPPAPPDPNLALRQTLDQLEQNRNSALQRYAEHRRSVIQEREQLAAGQRRLADAQIAVEAARARLSARKLELSEKQRENSELVDAVHLAQGTLQTAHEAAEAAEPKISIVPYDGRSGTARRPILIECRADAIRFIPEDVALSASDLEGFLPGYNPLLAGVIALRSYWSEVDGPGQPEPYVLLLVHEDGTAAYYAAKALLQSLDKQTGYELLTDDMKLAEPPLDVNAASECRLAVLETLQQRSRLMAEMVRRGVERETTFPTGRFEVDPREHDPTRDHNSIWAADGRMPGGAAPSVPQANDRHEPAAKRRSPQLAPMTPLDTAGLSASALARQASDAERSRRSENIVRDRMEDPSLLRQALTESWPSFNETSGGKRQWGTSSPTASISLERPVELDVSSQRITVGTQDPISIGPEGFTDEVAGKIIAAVQRECATWGRAPGEFFWSPRLRATVHTGATLPFDRLKPKLNSAGLRVSSRIVLEPAQPDFLELTHAASAP